ncbi:Glycerol 2-dehydrogenase (NADP(+)) [Emydomyces testavorans]|uniref:D-xylose reductase [NAD(P)H] n=1 Tax=Emydomyces testavorans TaxID=2070801 RepID=A0AAF0DPI7_9EURO|nr:Glycerol 2-dehydrogenase (NADP(+)) [Emydomyces testavorans]
MSRDITFRLSNGVTIPGLGFGTFSNDGVKGETYKAVLHALRTGYRHFDCAWFYMNEDEVGQAIKDFLKEKPSVKRSDLFITTKVWNHLHEADEVQWSLNNSLENLQLDYVDLFLVHWPIASEKDENFMPKLGPDGKYVIKEELTKNPEPTWRAMEALYNIGKTRAIGLSNFTIPGIKQILSFATIPPHVNQVEIHPFLPNTELIEFCFSQNILPEAYSPLGSQNQVPSTGEKLATDPMLNAIANQGGHTLAQVLIAWGLRRGYVVLPKSSNFARIEINFKEIELTEQQFKAVNQVAQGRHCRYVNMKDTFGYDVWPEESAGKI